MVIRKATTRDLPAIEAIYDALHTAEERGEATIGWQRGVYPTAETARQALLQEELFVGEDQAQIVGSAILNRHQLDMYRTARWQHPAKDDEVMVLHTLVIAPQHAGKGYGRQFIAFYEDYAATHGCPCLRLDTQEKNTPARALYRKLGYAEVDTVSCVFNGLRNIRLVLLEKWIGPYKAI